MVEVKGKSGITVKVICDSVSLAGKRITTLECTYPRIIHSELKTHRMLSTNSASSRAIPFDKMVEQLNGVPVRFGAANSGMQDTGESHNSPVEAWYDFGDYHPSPEAAWSEAKSHAVFFAEVFKEAGYHKQIYNRLIEPFQMMKTVITATEWKNFFHLRLDKAPDPTIQELAKCMKQAMDESTPNLLKVGHYHLPYVTTAEDYAEDPCQVYMINDGDFLQFLTLEEAIKVSCARCAAVSFRNTDYGLEKSLEVYDRLVNSDKVHGSALEHVATPIPEDMGGFLYNTEYPDSWPRGVSHLDKNNNLWSGNFLGWIQYRKTIPNESV